MGILNYYQKKKVLVTGHTGFKGSWLCFLLQLLGADAIGYALPPQGEEALFTIAGIGAHMHSIEGDIRDLDRLKQVFEESLPEVVFHLAAQPIVRTSYEDPVSTYETNVLGTVNLLECVRKVMGVRSVLNVTTDKVYENREWAWGYRETDTLDGYDPYSNSKSCSELVTHSYKSSFLDAMGIPVSTARAGNVIGGGDFARDRIIPDCIRAAMAGEKILVRNPYSIRPFQHVLEPLWAYLMIAALQVQDASKQGCYNVGPGEHDCITVGTLTDLFCQAWGEGASWENIHDGGPHEASFLKLDCSRIRQAIGWQPRWDIQKAVEKTVEWAKAYRDGKDIRACMEDQARDFMALRQEP